MSVELSILIVNWNTACYLSGCLESIRHSVRGVSYEVLVADNASADGSAQMVRERFPWVRFLETGSNLGFAAANNRLFAMAQGRKVMLLNPDTEMKEGCAEALCAFLDSHPACAACCPRFLYPDGSFQKFYRRLPSLSTFLAMRTFWLSCFPERGKKIIDRYMYCLPEDSFESERTVEQPGATCIVLRREFFGNEPLFDERFPLFFNDVDFSRRIRDRGGIVYYVPSASLIHYLGKGRDIEKRREGTEFTVSWLRYLRKHDPAQYLVAKSALTAQMGALSLANLFRAAVGRGEGIAENFRERRTVLFEKSMFDE